MNSIFALTNETEGLTYLQNTDYIDNIKKKDFSTINLP